MDKQFCDIYDTQKAVREENRAIQSSRAQIVACFEAPLRQKFTYQTPNGQPLIEQAFASISQSSPLPHAHGPVLQWRKQMRPLLTLQTIESRRRGYIGLGIAADEPATTEIVFARLEE